MTAAAELVDTDVAPEVSRSDAQLIASSLREPEDFAAIYAGTPGRCTGTRTGA
jgi:hypothetical protein